VTSTKWPGGGEIGEVAKVSDVPKSKPPKMKAVPESIAREGKLEELFMVVDWLLQF
jgi:hypothetical protein